MPHKAPRHLLTGIQTRLGLLITLVTTVMLVVFMVMDYTAASGKLHRDIEDFARRQAVRVARQLQVPAWNLDAVSISAVIAAEMEDQRVYAVALYERAGTMSGGEQQMLAMGRALMARPKVLLLDEPTMGLSPIMCDKIFEVVQAVAAQGVTILLVEQNANRALQLADRGYVMESGLITMSGEAKALLSDPRVRAAYLGE